MSSSRPGRDGPMVKTAPGSEPAGWARKAGVWLFRVASPTWALADCLKRGRERHVRTALIRRLNRIYLVLSIAVVGLTIILSGNDLPIAFDVTTSVLAVAWSWFLLSRATEVFYAFYRDAFDKLEGRAPSSALTPSGRVALALNSYAELILNFALLFRLLPATVWSRSAAPSSFTDILFYSANTITTSGGSGFTPGHWSLQLLTCYEILCGLILLVVCFAIYAGSAVGFTTSDNGTGIKPNAAHGDEPNGSDMPSKR